MQTKLYTKPWMKNFARNGDFRQMVKRVGCVTIRTVMLNEAVDVQGKSLKPKSQTLNPGSRSWGVSEGWSHAASRASLASRWASICVGFTV